MIYLWSYQILQKGMIKMRWWSLFFVAWFSGTLFVLAGALLAKSARWEYWLISLAMIVVGIIGLVIFKNRSE